MCLAIPAKLTAILDDDRAKASIGGVVKEISIALIDDPQPGEYVILHVGYALSKVDEDEALRTLKLMEDDGSLADAVREAAE